MFSCFLPLREVFTRFAGMLSLFLLLFILSTQYMGLAFAVSMTGEDSPPRAECAPDANEADECPGALGRLGNRIIRTWDEGGINLIVPLHTWHNHWTYDQDHIDKYNENPWGWGAGAALSMFDEDGDSHILFAMAFKDSWNKWEPFAGYGFLKNWYLDDNRDLRVGLGIELGITAREQYDYIPLPLPLPIFGIGYKQLSVEAAYIPGTWNNGNVLFTWARLAFY